MKYMGCSLHFHFGCCSHIHNFAKQMHLLKDSFYMTWIEDVETK
jgi:hypothetical protein